VNPVDEVPRTCRAVVYDPDDGSLDVRSFPIRTARPGEILVQVALSAICGSDLHTIMGRRRPSGPIILGHEICGTVAQLGEDVDRDAAGQPLSVGDRVTWSIAASCGTCFFCMRGLPQKCTSLFKYGHECIDVDRPLSGGFADCVYLAPGTAVYRLPGDLSDNTAVFANCSLATMAAAVRVADVQPGESVLIQGAGLVGLCASALCAARGASTVMVTDVNAQRLERAKSFGATHVFDANQEADTFRQAAADALGGSSIRRPTRPAGGFDVAIEVCGQPDVIPLGIESLRIGGWYVVAGCVFPGAATTLDTFAVTTRLIHIFGLHNYTPDDLQVALGFLTGPGRAYPFDHVVEAFFPLDQITQALEHVETHKEILRVALAP
jgi:alcohol dehydrogenase